LEVLHRVAVCLGYMTHCNTLQHCCNTVESSEHEVQHVLECYSVYVQHKNLCVRDDHFHLQHASACMQHNNFCVQHNNFCLQQSTISMCNTPEILCAKNNTFVRNTTTFVCNMQQLLCAAQQILCATH